MLDLQARVHFDEVERPVFVEELERSRAPVADRPAGAGAAFADRLDRLAIDPGSGRLLHDLLVPPLHGAIAFAQPDRLAVMVGKDLDFDVARLLQEALHVEIGIAEGRPGFGAGRFHRR